VNSNGLPDGVRAVVNVAGENILNPMKRYHKTVSVLFRRLYFLVILTYSYWCKLFDSILCW